MKDENGVVTFDAEEQAVVDKIIGERLGREGIAEMKEIMETLKDFDYEGTPAEVKAALKLQAENYKAQKAEDAKQEELESLQAQARTEGTSPELLAEIRSLKDEVKELKGEREAVKKAEKDQEEAISHRNEMIKEFTGEFPDVDLDKLSKNEKFMDFVQDLNPNLTISQAYKKFVKLYGQAEADAIAKIKSNIERSTSSGKAKGDVGGTHGLTQHQMGLADQNGISYKEYSEMLSLVKR